MSAIKYVMFVKPITVKLGGFSSDTKSAITSGGSPDHLELVQVQGGIEVKWERGDVANRIFVPSSNLAQVTYEPETVAKKVEKK